MRGLFFHLAWVMVGTLWIAPAVAKAQPVEGGTLDPNDIPKYVIPLVIPPVMSDAGTAAGGAATPHVYEIAVREFRQQILPGGIWNTINGRDDDFSPTTVWSYGPASQETPSVAPSPDSQFNYPAYTVEATASVPVTVRWINGLVEESGEFLPHLLSVDQTVHWANPPAGPGFTDSVGTSQSSYEGPVPIVTHVHGAHVGPESDGYPEAWYLPLATDIPDGYATSGTLFNDITGTNPGNLGYADFEYPNTQPAATLWYHDHTLGMTRLNVYAGPAGFWLVRGDYTDGNGATTKDGADDQSTPEPNDAVLPGPAAVAGQGVLDLNVPGVGGARDGIREIPIAIQDRSFNRNGQLFYPKHRSFFEGLAPRDMRIPFAPESDVLGIWQPEAFFNVMVVNGVSWPQLEVAQDRYRFRLLNGCNSRFLNLALVVVSPGPLEGTEIPFYQIGAEQGFLPQVVRIQTGEATPLPGDGTSPPPLPASHPDQALLMGLAERADVIVDFGGLPEGTIVRMINTAPDAPFGGFGDPPADSGTTGQVMQFLVTASLNGAAGSTDGGTTPVEDLVLNSEGALPAADNAGDPRNVSLNEEESAEVCVLADPVTEEFLVPIRDVDCLTPSPTPEGNVVVPFGPVAALLGTVDLSSGSPIGNPLKWTANGVGVQRMVDTPSGVKGVWVTESPALGSVEEWDIYNFTADAHPIHLHLVRFEVVGRSDLDGANFRGPEPWETGYKDTVLAYPGEITRIKAHFDIGGLYVWHCHIVEHEDNEMMRPYFVGD